MVNNRRSRTAQIIATALETESSVIVDVTTPEADSHMFGVMTYLCHYYGKYWIEYLNNGTAIIRKQG